MSEIGGLPDGGTAPPAAGPPPAMGSPAPASYGAPPAPPPYIPPAYPYAGGYPYSQGYPYDSPYVYPPQYPVWGTPGWTAPAPRRGQRLAAALCALLILAGVVAVLLVGIRSHGSASAPQRAVVGIPTGTTVSSTIPWTPVPSDGDASGTPISGGFEYSIDTPGEERWLGVPGIQPLAGLRADADVSLVSGPGMDEIGLGCELPDESDQFEFVINDAGWMLAERANGGTPSLISEGLAHINPAPEVNHLTILCASPTTEGPTHLMFAVNGRVVGDTTVGGTVPQGWIPVIEQCTCYGPSSGDFTAMTIASVPRTA